MKQNNFYSKYVSTHYRFVAASTAEGFHKRYYVWKSYLSKLLPTDKNISILEIGAGVGHNLSSLNKLGYRNILGTDYSRECIEECQKKGFNSYLLDMRTEKKFYRAHKNQFDMVLLYDVLEHYNPDKGALLLSRAKTLLKPDGFVLISLPNADHPLSNTLFFADITHKFIYNELSLSQLLRNCGFFRIRVIQINSFSLYDDNIFKNIFKKTAMSLVAFLGELFWRIMALSQGIILQECKPTLVAIAKR